MKYPPAHLIDSAPLAAGAFLTKVLDRDMLLEAATRKHAKNGGYSYCPISKLLLSFKIHLKMLNREKMNTYNKEVEA